MIDDAIESLKNGEFILIYDFADREGETDFAIRSDAINHDSIRNMRNDAGGLICTSIHSKAAEIMGLPFASDVLRPTHLAEKDGDIPYDRANHSSFSLWVNHKDTFTGVTDIDRALTANKLAEHVKHAMNNDPLDFPAEFRTPGHMATLRANDKLLDVRRGQTELSITLAELGGINPCVTICEMLDDSTGRALKKEDAMKYADDNGLVFIGGDEIVKFWEDNKVY
ncbi:3,4-dihydroxy 2-butanone 4-phosphate synthase [Methanomicrobium sp. W14]|jgi:3,4-dihydroxy 2-butanone 4-phosphate synthase|uniref:3,4-dihydroxy-2-butanone-4-phosphate synthase n=1 Tax=Methanomicrobium sp. W14 TaxID=2817839 RepID=UPI001AE59EA1|nr:3,4-dihydroxy-2-butanone-4-phosphate synthase [Methanomicrobium sp. W14]MBP2133777.1 3,4-dihydroxy 2-butanone 4-phosphate synthase [Methanomicrobium sp. W14]